MSRFHVVQLLAVSALAAVSPVAGQEHQHGPGEQKLGTVRFPTSCNAAAQPVFERGVAMLHSFWFAEAEKTFREAMQKDPSCGMPHWGVAMVKLGNPLAGRPSTENERIALEAAERAATLGAPTPRERAYAPLTKRIVPSSRKRQTISAWLWTMAR